MKIKIKERVCRFAEDLFLSIINALGRCLIHVKENTEIVKSWFLMRLFNFAIKEVK